MTDLDAGAMMMVKTSAGAAPGMNGELGGRAAAFCPLPVTAATAGQQPVSAPEPGPGPEMALVSVPVSEVTGRGDRRRKRETKAKKPAAAAGTDASAGTGASVRRRAGALRKAGTPGAMLPQTSIIIAHPPVTTTITAARAADFTRETSSGAASASESAASESFSTAGLGSPFSSAGPAEEGEPTGVGGGGAQAHSSLRAWLRRRQALGASAQELVFELHVRQGRPLADVAELLGLSLAGAQEHWRALRAEMAAAAPRQEADFTMLREHLAANLWVIVEQTHPREVVMEAGVEVETALPPCPRLLALRLRALDQISKLYGVNLERAAEPSGPPPYAAPPEIAREVRRKVLALHGRDELGMERADADDMTDEE